MIENYLSPVPFSIIEYFSESEDEILGKSIFVHDEVNGLPDFNEIDIAIVGVQEDRNSFRQHPCSAGADTIREKLYQLFPGRWTKRIADLGNIYKGETVEDTYFALKEVAAEVLKTDTILIIIGGSQDLTYANYRAYDVLEQTVNLTAIDSRFDLGRQNDLLHSESYLSHIVLQQPYNLFNYCNLGYQSYYVHPQQMDLMQNMFFDTLRLGEVRANLGLAEPVLRDTDVLTMDVAAIRENEITGSDFQPPHGFLKEEICALTRYAGISDKVSSFGIYNYSPISDDDRTTADFLAQAIWYFLEGVELRKGDYPYSSKSDYTKFTVLLEEQDMEMNFYKSPKSGRWWIEIPAEFKGISKHGLLPCTKEDYDMAKKGEITQRWWNAIKKTA
ncbi:MAG: formimidoylglutamase [Schleiferiaceae bacterium]|jgi:arginase family enzyme|nr:formimidoylglutamase [Schleiferiaceae bacterium]